MGSWRRRKICFSLLYPFLLFELFTVYVLLFQNVLKSSYFLKNSYPWLCNVLTLEETGWGGHLDSLSVGASLRTWEGPEWNKGLDMSQAGICGKDILEEGTVKVMAQRVQKGSPSRNSKKANETELEWARGWGGKWTWGWAEVEQENFMMFGEKAGFSFKCNGQSASHQPFNISES